MAGSCSPLEVIDLHTYRASVAWPYFFVWSGYRSVGLRRILEFGGVDEQQQRDGRQEAGRESDGQEPYQIIPAGLSGIPLIGHVIVSPVPFSDRCPETVRGVELMVKLGLMRLMTNKRLLLVADG